MELREFIKKVLEDTVGAVDDASRDASREINLAYRPERRTIEFDVAVSAEETTTKDGKGGVRVLSFAEASAGISTETTNSTVSRVTFGVDVNTSTKAEEAAEASGYEKNRLDRLNINDAR